ncbi:MAG TPA: ATP synthase F1 subunit delta [Candidatus Acidoferrales bacterium]|nr:ATP synthase F1 subunit delta [Candidatus Acidoferrales bacterium]
MAAGSGARRYAEALLDVATAENAVDAYRESLDRIGAALGVDTIHVLRDSRVPFAHRQGALEKATEGEPRAIRAVLSILLQRDRIALLPDVARTFSDLIDRRAGIVHAKVTTTVSLDETERNAIARRLEQASGTKIKATFAVDPALIGGVTVQLGDRLVDASLRTRLELMARQLASS